MSLTRADKTLYEFGLEVAGRSGILPLYRLNPSPESESALQNIEELLNSMQDFRHRMIEIEAQEEVSEPSLEEWLQNVSLLTDMDEGEAEKKNWVTLMTVHASKGLEFDHIFIVGMEENLFPNVISLTNPEQLEEERRLFYVAITRAKKSATISFAQTRFKWGTTEFCKPSRFIGDINPKYVDIRYAVDDDDEDRNDARSQIDRLRRRYDQNSGRTVVERKEFQSRPTPQQMERVQQFRPNIGAMKSVGERRVMPSEQGPANEGCVYMVGQRVSHAKFGRGTIVALEMLSNDTKITVQFDNPAADKKALLAKYAKLQVES